MAAYGEGNYAESNYGEPVSSGTSATVTAPLAVAVAAGLGPTVAANAAVTAKLAAAIASGLTPAFSSSADFTITAPLAVATVAALVPSVAASSSITTAPAYARAAGLVPAFSASATATSGLGVAVAAGLAPVWIQFLTAATDTSNFLNGRNRRARASVTVTRPVGAAPSNLGTKYDKAVPYPPPTLVDGRVT